MLDAAIKITAVDPASGFDPVTLLPTHHVVVKFQIGERQRGQITVKQSDFTQQHIEQLLNPMADTARQLGLLPTA